MRFLTIATLLAAFTATSFAAHKAENPRHYATGNYALFIDNTFEGYISGVEDPTLAADTQVQKIGATHVVSKQEGNVTYRALRFRCGAGMGASFTSWLSDSVAGKVVKHSVEIESLDLNMKVLNHLQMTGCLMSQVEFPTFNASSKDNVYLNVEISPTTSKEVAGDLSVVTNTPRSTKAWSAADFKLSLNNIDCSHVTSIESMLFWMDYVDTVGTMHQHVDQTGKLKLPKLEFVEPTQYTSDFTNWAKAVLVNLSSNTRAGSVDMTSNNHTTIIFHLDLVNAFPIKMTEETLSAGDTVKKMKIEVDFQMARLTVGPGA